MWLSTCTRSSEATQSQWRDSRKLSYKSEYSSIYGDTLEKELNNRITWRGSSNRNCNKGTMTFEWYSTTRVHEISGTISRKRKIAEFTETPTIGSWNTLRRRADTEIYANIQANRTTTHGVTEIPRWEPRERFYLIINIISRISNPICTKERWKIMVMCGLQTTQ